MHLNLSYAIVPKSRCGDYGCSWLCWRGPYPYAALYTVQGRNYYHLELLAALLAGLTISICRTVHGSGAQFQLLYNNYINIMRCNYYSGQDK